MPDGLLEDVKAYLHITWEDTNTEINLTGMINRGMARLQTIAGVPLDFTEENNARALLFDYVRYANSQALEIFEENFSRGLTALHIQSLIDSEPEIVEEVVEV